MNSLFRNAAMMISVSLSISMLNAQWTQQNSGTTEMLRDVAMPDSTTAIAVGTMNSILKTTNAGATWSWVPLPISSIVNWNAVSFYDGLQGAIAGRNLVATTVDGGTMWEFHSMDGIGECLSVLHVGSGRIYMGDDSGRVYRSLDTGRTWTFDKISERSIITLFPWRGLSVWGALILYALTPNSIITKTTYPVDAWGEEAVIPIFGLGSAAMDGEFCNGGGPGFIVGVQGDLIAAPAIMRKSLTDSVWRSLATDELLDGTLYGVSAPSENIVYVCGSKELIYKSVNGGDAWTACAVPGLHTLYAINFYDEKRGFAVGDSGTILFTSNGALTDVSREKGRLPNRYVLEQNYPNPFNPKTVINYQIPEKSRVSLKVYNLLGREVATLFQGIRRPGNYEATFNGSGLASGVYFYELRSADFVETKKLLLLK